MSQPNFLEPNDTFVPRHIGPTAADIQEMLAALSLPSLEALVEATVPSDIRLQGSLTVPSPRGEQDVLAELRGLAEQNHVWRSLIGMGYYDCITPLVIQRNILENPGWYTQYTPYQAEIAQGRLEALVNFQTMVADLTGLPLANASLLDEATAAAEAMTMCAAMSRAAGLERKKFFVSEKLSSANDCRDTDTCGTAGDRGARRFNHVVRPFQGRVFRHIAPVSGYRRACRRLQRVRRSGACCRGICSGRDRFAGVDPTASSRRIRG